MKIMPKCILGCIILLWTSNFTKCQNIIRNGGFEHVEEGGEFPEINGDAEDLDFWQTRTSDAIEGTGIEPLKLHSPDWIYDNQGQNLSIGARPPKSGSGLIGMFQYELIQQKIDGSQLDKYKKYKLSFYLRRGPENSLQRFENSKLSFYLMKSRVRYKDETIFSDSSEEWCSNKYKDFKFESFNEIEMLFETIIDINVSDSSWTKYSILLDLPEVDCINLTQGYCGYNWIMIQLENINDPFDDNGTTNANCEDGYIYLDEVSLTEANGCEIICRTPLGNIEYEELSWAISPGEIETNFEYSDPINNLLNNLFPNWNDETPNYPLCPFAFRLKGAIGYTFEVFSRESETIYYRSEIDVNGLKDVGFDDYILTWHGNDAALQMIPFELYPYKISAWNCEDEIVFDGFIVYIGVPEEIPIKPLFGELYDNTCCPDVIMIQNKEYLIDETVKAVVTIRAGSEVNPQIPYGPVTFMTYTNGYSPYVKYMAPNIDLQDGFDPGLNFEAVISECSQFEERRHNLAYDRDIFLKSFSAKKTISNYKFPNPMKKNYSYPIPEYITHIEIHSVEGKQIYLKNMDVLFFSNQSQGMYIVKYYDEITKNWYSEKIILSE